MSRSFLLFGFTIAVRGYVKPISSIVSNNTGYYETNKFLLNKAKSYGRKDRSYWKYFIKDCTFYENVL